MFQCKDGTVGFINIAGGKAPPIFQRRWRYFPGFRQISQGLSGYFLTW